MSEYQEERVEVVYKCKQRRRPAMIRSNTGVVGRGQRAQVDG
jgi:hypothetical protein